jgi:hypothetical protein
MNLNIRTFAQDVTPPGGAAPAPMPGLVGVWELASIDIEFRDDGTRRPASRSVPSAYLMFTPLGRLLAMLTRPICAPASGEWLGAGRDGEALFRATFAYSGRYRLEQDRWVTRVDRTWNDAWTDAVQAHAYRLDHGRLTVLSPWLLGDKEGDRLQRMLFSFERMKTRQ